MLNSETPPAVTKESVTARIATMPPDLQPLANRLYGTDGEPVPNDDQLIHENIPQQDILRAAHYVTTYFNMSRSRVVDAIGSVRAQASRKTRKSMPPSEDTKASSIPSSAAPPGMAQSDTVSPER